MWRLTHSSLPYALRRLTGDVSSGTGVLWSLSIEEYFYILWAPAVLWMNRKWLTITGIAICLGAFTFRWLGSIGVDSYFSIFHRFDALIFGSFVALLISSNLPQNTLNAILIVAGLFGAAMLAQWSHQWVMSSIWKYAMIIFLPRSASLLFRSWRRQP